MILFGIMLLLTTLMILFVIIVFIAIGISLFMELPYVGTTNKKVETIMKFAQIKKNQTAVDLGSGDGRLLIKSAQLGAKAIGYEINPLLIALTKIKFSLMSLREAIATKQSQKRDRHGHMNDLAMTNMGEIVVKRRSLWEADLKVADVIFVYALKKSMKKFEDFVFSNARPGTRIVVNTNPFPNKKPQKQEDGIFLYIS